MNRSIKIDGKNKKNMENKNQKRPIKHTKCGAIIALLLLIITGLFLAKTTNSLNSTKVLSKLIFSKSNVKAADTNISEENLAIGQVGYISEAIIAQRKTGVGPFDDDNEPGNDMNEDNDIVRSFDQITWTLENTLSLKNTASGESYTGGVLEIKAELPEVNVEGSPSVYKWDLASMTWAENSELLENGRIFTAQYSLSSTQITVPGKQNLEFILKILGAPNGLQITPTFTVNIAGNNEDEKKIVTDTPVTVSATPRVNMTISRNTYLNYKSNFDFSTGNSNLTATENSLYGRMQGYVLLLRLYNSSASKKLKGIEIPKGDITFDITFNETLGTTNVTETEGWTPTLWEYKPNNENNNGINSRNMFWNNDERTKFSYDLAPLNSGGGQRCCYKGGSWTIIQDDVKPYIYHITIKNYEFSSNFVFPSKCARGSATYSANHGIFSTGYIQAIAQIPETTNSTGKYYMKATISNLSYKTISDVTVNQDIVTTDNVSNTQLDIGSTGATYGKRIWYGNASKTDYDTGDASSIIGNTNATIISNIRVGTNNEESDWVYGLDCLVKIDDKAIDLKLTDNNKEYKYASGSSTNMKFNVLYAGKSDKTGWTSDTEMNNTSMDDLVYFDTLEELKQNNYVCVGALFESTSGYINSTGIQVSIPFNVKPNADIGNVYQALNDVRLYNMGNIPDRSTQTHLLTTNKEDYPSIKWSSEKRKYTKTAYDESQQIMDGTHSPGVTAGDSLLILGARPKVPVSSVDSEQNTKTNYDLGRNENIATFLMTPTLKNAASPAIIDGVNLKIEAILPQELTYEIGSCNIGEPETVVNGNKTTLTWYIYNCTVNNTIEPIFFNTHINENTLNGTQLTVKTIISEYLREGENTKIGSSIPSLRTSSTSINIVNLESYNLYKTTETPVIEANGTIKFTLTTVNKTDADVNTFQLLDILPYNGDGRETNFNGTYNIESIQLNQINMNTEETLDNDNLQIFITENASVRNGITAKDEGIGIDAIWESAEPGSAINKALTAMTVKGTLKARTKVEIELSIKTDNNKPGDIYKNSASAQTNIASEEMQSPIVTIQVIKRSLEGKIWLDNNHNGIIDDEESYLQGIKVNLLNEDGTPANDIEGNQIPQATTDQNGYYKFTNLPKGNYIIKIESLGYIISPKNVGYNQEINSKFNENGKTDVITTLNNTNALELNEQYVNAGLTINEAEVRVNHYIMNEDGTKTNESVPLQNGETATEEIIYGKVGDTYETNPIEPIDYYELVETPENNNGNMTEETINVIYYYQLKKYAYTVNYYDIETKEKIKETKQGNKKYYGVEIISEQEVIDIENYVFDSAEKQSIIIGKDETKNVINLYYKRKTGSVTTKYVDIENGEEITIGNKTSGGIGENYETDKKELQGYVFIKDTNNTTGKYKTSNIDVIYYYRKQIFNLKIDKWIDEAYINGVRQKALKYDNRSNIYKVEINKKKIANGEIKVVYKIRITNDGEIPGSATILKEKIPEGFIFNQDDNIIKWNIENGELITNDLKDTIIEPGKYEEIDIVLRWKNGEENFGTKKNIVSISNTENEFNYSEQSRTDNTSESNMVISVATGLDKADMIIIQRIAILTLVFLAVTGCIIIKIKKSY